MSWIDRLKESGAALLASAGASAAFEALFKGLAGISPPAGYLLVYFTLALVAGLLLSLLAAPPWSSFAVALGVFSASALGPNGGGIAATLGGLSTFALCLLGKRAKLGAGQLGALVGVSLAFVLLIWPRFLTRFLPDYADALSSGALSIIPFAACLGTQIVIASLYTRPRFRFAPAAAFVLVAWTAIIPVFTRSSQPERHMPHLDSPAQASGKPSFIVLILDTVRADHLSVYGYERNTTPRLSAFLRRNPRAVLYPMAFAPATWTLPSHASFFTGTLPSSHGADERTMFTEEGVRRPVLVARETLAEFASKNGYRTAGIFANGLVLHADGMQRGFDWFFKPLQELRFELLGEQIRNLLFTDTYSYVFKAGPSASRVNKQVLRFIDDSGKAPYLVVANYLEAHAPYTAEPPFRGAFTEQRISDSGPATNRDSPELLDYLARRYDEEILALDFALGTLLKELDQRGALNRTWLVVTADHGEAFGAHGLTEHGTCVYNEVTRIPLIISPPKGVELPRSANAVSLIDVTATISKIIGGSKLGVGRDLLDNSGKSLVQIEFFGDKRKARDHGDLAAMPARAVATGAFKFLEHGPRSELYSLIKDPLEQNDRSAELPDIARQLAKLLPDPAKNDSHRKSRAPTMEEKQQLKALGYTD